MKSERAKSIKTLLVFIVVIAFVVLAVSPLQHAENYKLGFVAIVKTAADYGISSPDFMLYAILIIACIIFGWAVVKDHIFFMITVPVAAIILMLYSIIMEIRFHNYEKISDIAKCEISSGFYIELFIFLIAAFAALFSVRNCLLKLFSTLLCISLIVFPVSEKFGNFGLASFVNQITAEGNPFYRGSFVAQLSAAFFVICATAAAYGNRKVAGIASTLFGGVGMIAGLAMELTSGEYDLSFGYWSALALFILLFALFQKTEGTSFDSVVIKG